MDTDGNAGPAAAAAAAPPALACLSLAPFAEASASSGPPLDELYRSQLEPISFETYDSSAPGGFARAVRVARAYGAGRRGGFRGAGRPTLPPPPHAAAVPQLPGIPLLLLLLLL